MSDATPTQGPKQVIAQLAQLWSRQSKRRKVIAIAVVLGIAGVIAMTTLSKKSEAWSAVAEGSSPDDAQELLSALQARSVPARLREGKVEVAAERADEARAIAAAAGLPRTGKGFELFDGSSLGQSSFSEQVNYRRALQGELSRSIIALAQVQGARVHLALGKRSVFKDQSEPASASVALHLHAGQTLTMEQVRGVRQLVAASVEGLKPESVVLVDNHGNLLDASETTSADRRSEIERSVSLRVRSMLERVVGPGRVSVVATAVVDDRKVSETQELYDHEHPALRSETRTAENDGLGSGVGGLAGTRANAPGAPAAGPTQPGATAAGGRVQETRNYEVSRTVRQTTKPDAQLTRLHLAVVVDYKADAEGKAVARTEKEIAELTALARHAAGIDDARGDKIELRSLQFATDPDAAAAQSPAPATELPILYIAAGAGALVLLALVVLAVRRSRKRREEARRESKLLAFPAPVADLERVLDARPSNELEKPAEPEAPTLPPGQNVRDRVLEAVRGDVERTAEVLTSWLSEVPSTANAK